MLKGMIVTRADNRMKQLFLSGEMLTTGKVFKGFRSLGQEVIYGGALRLQQALLIIKTGNGRAMS